MREIEIVGGGLAGLSLGVALAREGVPVRVREASVYPRHRVCGEFLNGVTWETLERLGIADLFDDALRHELTRWWVGEEMILESQLSRPALGMSRWVMDERLRVCFEEAGGVLSVNDRAVPVPREGLVWTAGRRLTKGSALVGLKAHFMGVDLDGFLEMHVGEGAYVGMTPVSADGERVNVCGLFRKEDLAGGRNPMVTALRRCGLPEVAGRLERAEMDGASLTGVSGLHLGGQGAADGLCTLGDAERMIPPFTGNGMSMAFESAECALPHLLAYAREEVSWEVACAEIRGSLEGRFAKRVRLALGLHRCLTSAAGRVALRSAGRSGVLPFRWLHERLC